MKNLLTQLTALYYDEPANDLPRCAKNKTVKHKSYQSKIGWRSGLRYTQYTHFKQIWLWQHWQGKTE